MNLNAGERDPLASGLDVHRLLVGVVLADVDQSLTLELANLKFYKPTTLTK